VRCLIVPTAPAAVGSLRYFVSGRNDWGRNPDL